jgi:ubiquinone/menaquinone biosynthesis C-methylase UbiE
MITDQNQYPIDLAEMVAWIHSHAQPGARVLEIGSGDGVLVDALADEFDVLGVDPHSSGGGRVVVGGFEELDVEPFDLVFASVALHHLHDEDTAAEALARLTRPGSVMLVREFDREHQDHEPTLRWWHDRRVAAGGELPEFDDFLSHWREMMPRHIWSWSRVKSMLERAGFQTEDEYDAPYLYRWQLAESDRIDEVRDAAAGRIRLIGRHWTGRRPTDIAG